jgi:hypothetical protein
MFSPHRIKQHSVTTALTQQGRFYTVTNTLTATADSYRISRTRTRATSIILPLSLHLLVRLERVAIDIDTHTSTVPSSIGTCTGTHSLTFHFGDDTHSTAGGRCNASTAATRAGTLSSATTQSSHRPRRPADRRGMSSLIMRRTR